MSYMYQYDLVVISVESKKDEKGNFVNKEVKKLVSKCRHSIKTNIEFKNDNIKTILAEYIIHCPLDEYEALKELKVGQNVQVLDSNGEMLAKGSILGVHKGYYNFRIWL